MTTIPADAVGTVEVVGRGDNFGRFWVKVPWGAIMAGAVCAIAVQLVMTVLGIAVGISAAEGPATSETVRTLGVAAGAWWLVTGTLSLFAGGYVVGWMAGEPRNGAICVEGAAMWGVVALFGFMVLWSGTSMAAFASPPLTVLTSASSMPGRAGMLSVAERAAQNGAMAEPDARSDTSILRPSEARMEEARRAARTASWWAVVGMVAGLVASVGGARMGVPNAIKANR